MYQATIFEKIMCSKLKQYQYKNNIATRKIKYIL